MVDKHDRAEVITDKDVQLATGGLFPAEVDSVWHRVQNLNRFVHLPFSFVDALVSACVRRIG